MTKINVTGQGRYYSVYQANFYPLYSLDEGADTDLSYMLSWPNNGNVIIITLNTSVPVGICLVFKDVSLCSMWLFIYSNKVVKLKPAG